jgi:glycolate oxidase subunit GlcD
VDKLAAQLRALLSDAQVLSEPDELLVYECDGLTHYRARPRAVVFPHSTEEVSEVVQLLVRERVPFAPRGAGTGLSGGALALAGGVCVELARMRRLLSLDPVNRTAVVEAGVVNAQVSRAAAAHGLYYVPDPSSQATCTVGGNIAENAGGIHCLKYGTTVDHILAARVVLADGSIVRLGGAADEPDAYDLLGLFVGSEGTFGIATEATLRLMPVAPSVRTLLAEFMEVDAASRAVSAIIAAGIVPAALEMVDGATIRAVEQSVFAAGLPTDAAAALLVELDGTEAGLDEEAERVGRVCREGGARSIRLARDEAERKQLWAARKGAFGALGRLSPDLMLQDAVVPRTRLPEILAETYRIGTKYNLRVANVFHAGDGNLHPFICYDSRDPGEVVRVKEAGREIIETCVRAGGTITGEHGVGLDKSEYLPLVCSDQTLAAMLRVRAAFDPTGLCNPGKIIPAPPGCGEARAAAKAGARSAGAGVPPATTQALSAAVPRDIAEPAASDATGEAAPRGEISETAPSGEISEAARPPEAETAAGRATFAPSCVEEVSAALLRARRMRRRIVVGSFERGRQTESPGDEAQSGSIHLSLERMNQLVEHEPADLVATAEAGMTIGDFNERVGRAGQWLALDAPGGDAETLGAVVARGLGGAQAFGYGPPRRHVIGMTVALADGSLIRVGGRVVKNVAGYDLAKLFTGSRGTLGIILDVTVRLRPRPQSERTLVAYSSDRSALSACVREVIDWPLFPVAAELLSPALADLLLSASADGFDDGEKTGASGEGEYALLLRFAGTDAAVTEQLARAREICRGVQSAVCLATPDDDAPLWQALSAAASERAARLIWRAALPPAALDDFLKELTARRGRIRWHACAGDGRVRVVEAPETSDAAAFVSDLSRLREQARASGGSLVVERAPDPLARDFDLRGLSTGVAELMSRLKRQLDPDQLFGPQPSQPDGQ